MIPTEKKSKYFFFLHEICKKISSLPESEVSLSLDGARPSYTNKHSVRKERVEIEGDGVGGNLELVVGRYCKYLQSLFFFAFYSAFQEQCSTFWWLQALRIHIRWYVQLVICCSKYFGSNSCIYVLSVWCECLDKIWPTVAAGIGDPTALYDKPFKIHFSICICFIKYRA